MPNQHTKKVLAEEAFSKAAGTPEAPQYRDMTTNVTDLTNSVAKTVQSFGQQGIKVDVEFSYPPARVKITVSW